MPLPLSLRASTQLTAWAHVSRRSSTRQSYKPSTLSHLRSTSRRAHSSPDTASCFSATDALACLRAADVSALEMANMNLNLGEFFGTYAFVPVVDGTFIVERPTVTLEKRRVNGVRSTML